MTPSPKSVFEQPAAASPLPRRVKVLVFHGSAVAFGVFYVFTVISMIPWLLRLGSSGEYEEKILYILTYSFASSVFYASMTNVVVCYLVLLWVDSAAARAIMRRSIPVAVWSFPLVHLINILQTA